VLDQNGVSASIAVSITTTNVGGQSKKR
jgi:hypothetical protein